MTVHFVSGITDVAMGRFIGPGTLLQKARDLYPDFPHVAFPADGWKAWVDLLEATGTLVAPMRWRIPPSVLRYLWAAHDKRRLPGLDAAATASLQAIVRWDRAVSFWGHDGYATQALHPLDDPQDGTEALVESTAAVPWTRRTYRPVSVATGRKYLRRRDPNACVPLFRGWQAMHLGELLVSGDRLFAGLASPLRVRGVKPLTWRAWTTSGGFDKHRSALEALSWYETYTRHALMLERGDAPDPGRFTDRLAPAPQRGNVSVFQGEALGRLRAAERRVAREALNRNGLEHSAIAGAAGWLAEAASRNANFGREPLAREYARLGRLAMELLEDDGLTSDEVTTLFPGRTAFVERFFPPWVKGRRRALLLTLQGDVAAFFRRHPHRKIPEVDNALLGEFTDWLEAETLLDAHMAIPELARHGHRPGTEPDVATAFHLAGLASWVEHVCNALPVTFSELDALEDKLKKVWAGHPLGQRFGAAMGKMAPPEKGGSDREFGVRLVALHAHPARSPIALMARDARIAQLLRNEGTHVGLRSLTREEAFRAAIVLLRVAVACWLANRGPSPVGSAPNVP